MVQVISVQFMAQFSKLLGSATAAFSRHLRLPPAAIPASFRSLFKKKKKKKKKKIKIYIYIKEAKDAHKRGQRCPPKEAQVAHQKRPKLPILLAIGPSFIYWHLWYCPCQFWPCGVVTQVRPLWYCFKPRLISAHCWFFFLFGHWPITCNLAFVALPMPIPANSC
jgi:hypothetical protein